MGQLCDSCRRSAAEAAAAELPLAKPAKPVPHGLVAAADAAATAGTTPTEEKPSITASSAAFSSGVQELRKRGIRPKMPGYNDTPLMTVGKQVRILKETGFRTALIEYVNDDGTVDVAYEDGNREDETVCNDVLRPLEGYEDATAGPREKTTEEKRQLGIRANAPGYHETPLLSVGKVVRIKPSAGRIRRAEIEYVDDAAGTVDVRYRPPVEVWPGASVVPPTKKKECAEESVPISKVHALEEVEIRKETAWSKQFKEDFYGAITSLKDGADDLLMEVKDYDASLEYYSMAIKKLKDIPHSELVGVIVSQEDGLAFGRVNVVDAKTQQAFVKLSPDDGSDPKTISVPLDAITPIHERQVSLQGSLYANRARIWALLDRPVEAHHDLSVTIALQAVSDEGEAWNDCLAKARLLRAKLRLSEDNTTGGKEDIKEALALEPPKATADIVWQFYSSVEKQIKAKKIDKNVIQFASELPLD